MSSTFIMIGALLAALAVGLGAFGAHGLKTLVEQGKFSAKDLETFQTAVQYQMIHALGLTLIGLLGALRPSGMLDAAGWTMLVGILLFSGFLYTYVATGTKLFALFVPIGGVAFILAWLAVAVAAMRRAP
ncbi:MAG: DUF423 domain-containing protein [Thermoguttaceae bacterium]|jgi:uncharacterized membrane protein YgdD (TMEM256/DUF423 family)